MKEKYEIEIERPKGVSITQMKDYIKDAVDYWGNQFEPPNAYGDGGAGNPLFGHKECNVKRIYNFTKTKRTKS